MAHPEDDDILASRLVDDDVCSIGIDSNWRIDLGPLAGQRREAGEEFKRTPKAVQVTFRRPDAERLDPNDKDGFDVCFRLSA